MARGLAAHQLRSGQQIAVRLEQDGGDHSSRLTQPGIYRQANKFGAAKLLAGIA
jgi:hypothetical protein